MELFKGENLNFLLTIWNGLSKIMYSKLKIDINIFNI